MIKQSHDRNSDNLNAILLLERWFFVCVNHVTVTVDQ